MRAFVRDGLTALGVAAGYYACATIGSRLSVPPSGFAIIWPATAFLISVLLLLPRKLWWLCAASVVLTHFILAAAIRPDTPLVVVLTQVGGNLLLAVTTVLAVRAAIATRVRFDSFGVMLKFLLIAGLAVPAVVNAAILSVHLATGWIHDFRLSWEQWMIAGIFPTITLPPALVLALKGGFTGRPRASAHAGLELAVVAPLSLAVGIAAYGGAVNAASWPAMFLAPLPLLLWAAVRVGVGGTSLSLILFALGISAQALRHHGPFAEGSPIDEIVSLQVYLVTTSIPLMLLAALLDERRRSADWQRQSDARMQWTAASTDTGLWQWEEDAKQLWLTRNCRAMFGLGADPVRSPFAFVQAVHPDDQERVRAALERAMREGATRGVEFRVLMGDEIRSIYLDTSAELEGGKAIRVSGVFKDISERVAARRVASRLRRQIASMQDNERRRIADELHESTAQHLIAATLYLTNLKARMPDLQPELDEILESVREAATEIRTFSYLLRPPEIDGEGLSSFLRRYVPGFERRTGLHIALRVNPLSDELPPEQQHAMLRIAQECLGNVHRFAKAHHVWLSVRCIGGGVHLVVRHDGETMGPDNAERIEERVRLGMTLPVLRSRQGDAGEPPRVYTRVGGRQVHLAIRFPGVDAATPATVDIRSADPVVAN
jgi:signal transduction histidine kinase